MTYLNTPETQIQPNKRPNSLSLTIPQIGKQVNPHVHAKDFLLITGKPSSNNELSEHLQSSSVPSNIPQTSEQSASTYPTTSDSPSSGPITCNIKTEADDSLQLIQIDNAEDNSGLDSGEQFKTVPTGDSKSFSDDVQNTHGNHLHYNVGHQGVWQEEPPHQVELFKVRIFL